MNLDQFRADPAAVHMVVDDADRMQRPMLPIDRKGMPVPGPNFREMASAIRGPDNPLPLAGKGKKIELSAPCVELSFLIWRALYGPLQIPIKVKTERVRAEFLPGGFYLAEGPQGPASADVMMISKHPGFDDVAQHANYSGKAASPLFEALTELGAIDEAYGWYATHLVKHANLDPTAGSVPVAWIDDGRPILEQEIALVQPKVIVCLGGEAIKELLGKEYNVTNMSQRVLTITRQVPGGFGDLATGENFVEHAIKVVALPNPASVAKRRETFPEFLEQLRFVVRTVRGEEAPRLDAGLDHQVIRTLPHLRRAVDRILREEPAPIVAWDAEWHGQHWDAEGAFLCTVQFTHRPRVAFLLDLCDTDGKWVFQGRPEAIAAELRRLVDARGSRHGGHWFKADIPWIRTFLGVDLGPSYEPPHYAKSDGRRIIRPWDRTKHEGGFDTGYMLHAVYEDATSGKLEDVAARFLGVPHYNLELEEWKSAYCNKHKIKKKELEGYGQIDRRVLFPYACLHQDSLVQLADGRWRKISELVAEKYDGNVVAFQDGHVVHARVVNWHRRNVNQRDWFKLRTATTRSGRHGLIGPALTPDHQVYTRRGKVRVDALFPGQDEILTEDRELTPHQLSIVLGSLLGDGGFSGKNGVGYGFRFSQRPAAAAYADWKASALQGYRPEIQHGLPDDYRGYACPFGRVWAKLREQFPVHAVESHSDRKAVVTDRLLANLGDLGLAVWYQDDGTLVEDKRDGGLAVRIYAKLGEDEAARVVAWLGDRIGHQVEYNSNSRFISIGRKAAAAFLAVVRPYAHPAMAYKFGGDVAAAFVPETDGPPLYERIEEVVRYERPKSRRGYGVRYCLTVEGAHNFLTQAGFVSNCWDVDVTRRLYDVFNGVGDKDGLLDKDHRGLNSRKPFWVAQQAGIVFAEMEATGVGTDEPRAIELTEVFKRTRDELLESLRAQIGWSSFNIGSTDQLTELLFGPEFHHKKTETGDIKRLRPPEAVEPFRLTPVKSTGKPGKDWAKVVKKGEENILRPATDKETLGILMHQTDDRLVKATLRKIRDIKFIGKVLTSALRPGKSDQSEAPPDDVEEVAEYVPDVLVAGDAGLTYDGGILYYRGPGNRVRSRFYPVETGRCSSSAPNCQNLCVDADTEYMTHRGWVRAPELRPDDRVAQYWTDSGAIDFVVPTEVHVSHFKGDMHRIRTDKQIDLLVTPAHRCLLRNRQTGELTDDPATEFKPDRQHIHAGLYAGGSESLPPELVTWLCAVQADGSYHPGGGITFAFSKARKTERLRAALSALGADFTEAWSESRQVTTFYLGRPGNEELIAATKSLLGEARQFGPWILDMDRRTLDCFRDELFHWDGLFTRKTEFSSSDKINADWAQIVFALSGMRARMRLYRPKNPKAKDHHCVNITRDRTAYSMTTNFTRDLVPWDDNVYCVTVPSGFIVVRREGKVSVTGNSKRREDDYARINGYWEVDKKTGERRAKGDYIIGDEDAIDGLWSEPRYTSPLRSIIREDDGYLMFEFDIKSAEVAILAWLAGDVAMMDDVRRNMLPEDHPDYIDIHSKTAVEAFKLDCPPTKKGLKSIGKVGIRVAAKNVRFGVPYGRSAAAISRQCLEEGTVVSIEDCEGLVLGYHTMYPQASAYLTACENRPIEPGWMVSPFGRYRRFAATDDEKIVASYGRAAKNFCIQSSVADWVMLLMWKLVEYRRRHGGAPGRQFEMALQVHDALVLRVPYASVEWVWNEVVPDCIRMIPIMPRTLDGVLLPGQGPYYFGVDMELFQHWSVGLHGPDLEKLGIPAHRLKGAA